MVDDKSEEYRIRMALLKLESLLLSEEWMDPQPKSSAVSIAARKAGNDIYNSKRAHDVKSHLDAIREYTRSVAFALPGSEELGLAYGNRSALLMHLGRYRDCIVDIDKALELPVGDLRRIKFLCRKVECEVALDLQEDAKFTCQFTQCILQNANLPVETKKEAVINLVNAMYRMECGDSSTTANNQRLEKPKIYLEEKFKRRSPECPEASSALSITKATRNVRYGRHLTANRNILTGETLYTGEPYVGMPTISCIHSHCSHCLMFVWTGIPCDNCSQVVYCSDECKTKARDAYHDVECKIIDRIWKMCGPNNSGRIMSVRILIMAIREAGGLHELVDRLRKIDDCEDTRKKGFTDNNSVFVNNCESIYSLLSNVRKKEDDDLKKVSSDSAVLLHLLADRTRVFSKYFDNKTKDLLMNDDAMLVGKLLSHYQHIVSMNATLVSDAYNITTVDWNWSGPTNSSGLYLNSFLSFLNHSCYPNVAKCETLEGKTILFAIRPIAKNEQLFESYGPWYYEMPKKNRQELIKRYCFTCDCIACTNDWPIFINTISSGIEINAGTQSEMTITTTAMIKADKIIESLKDNNYRCDVGCLENLAYALTLIVKYTKLPNAKLAIYVDSLIAVFNDLYGYVIAVPETCDN